MITPLPLRYDVAEAVEQIEANPDVWNLYRDRLDREGSPHACVSDIWVRFRPIAEMGSDPADFFLTPHASQWYPVIAQLPAIQVLALQLFFDVGGVQLGGVLVTKIPPGGEVKPHVDAGWHAAYYEKFAIQLKGNAEQAFCFDDSKLSALPGEAYMFDNSKRHWVENPTDEDRMTLIVCIRRSNERLH